MRAALASTLSRILQKHGLGLHQTMKDQHASSERGLKTETNLLKDNHLRIVLGAAPNSSWNTREK